MTLSEPQLRLLRQARSEAPWVRASNRTANLLKARGLVTFSYRDEPPFAPFSVRVHLTEAGRQALEENTK